MFPFSLARLPRRMFYGWWIVAGGMIAQAMMNGLFFLGFSFFFEPMRTQFGWSRTLLAGAYSMTRVESGFFGPLEGFLIQRYGARRVMMVAFVVFALGFLLLSQVKSPLTFYLAFFVVSVGASTAGFNPVMVSLNNWFRRKRARAIGMTMLGMSIGGLVFSPALAFSIDRFGWQDAALGAGLFVALVGLPISMIMRDNPEPYGYLPDGARRTPGGGLGVEGATTPSETAGDSGAPLEYDFTVKEALRTRAFWMLSSGHALGLMVVSIISLLLVPYMEDHLGYSGSRAASVIMIMTAVSMVGQFSAGYLADIFPKNLLAAACLLGHAGALFLLGTADNYSQVVLAVVVQGAAWGVRSPLTTVLRGDFFGRKYFAMITGISNAVLMVGMVVGPLMSGLMADKLSYGTAFMVMGACALPGVLLFAMLRSPQPQVQEVVVG